MDNRILKINAFNVFNKKHLNKNIDIPLLDDRIILYTKWLDEKQNYGICIWINLRTNSFEYELIENKIVLVLFLVEFFSLDDFIYRIENTSPDIEYNHALDFLPKYEKINFF